MGTAKGKVDRDLARMTKAILEGGLIVIGFDSDDVKNAQMLIKSRAELITQGTPEKEAIRQIDEAWDRIKPKGF